ncbi:MAG: IclR family transcriptional regulator [Candidatus Nanopelagicaceae bacterium]
MTQRVQSVERALGLLDALASYSSPPTIPELAKAAKVNRATAWRLMKTLVAFELAERNEITGTYKVGPGALRLAAATDNSSFVRRARPLLEKVASKTNGSAFLEIATRGELIVMDQVRSNSPIQVDLAGMVVPLHCGSVGKLYLATLSDDELNEYLKKKLPPLTKYTITKPLQLKKEILEARVTGIAINYKEHREEWCGISAAIQDRAGRSIAYLNVTLPTFNNSKEKIKTLSPTLRSAASEIATLFNKGNY